MSALGYNPFYGAGEPYYRALSVYEVLKDKSESWGVQLAESTRCGLMLLAEARQPLTRLEDLFVDEEFLDECLQHSKTQSVIRFWDRFQAETKERRQSMTWPVVNKVSMLLATESLRNVLGHSKPIDLGRVLDTPGSIILVSLAVDELHGAARMLGSLLLSSISRELFSRAGSQSTHNPVRIYVDEFEHFAADFETMLCEGRRFDLSLVLAHQTLAQLTPQMRSMTLNNVGVKLAFRCGREDSPNLSRDLTGDPKAVDLNDLPPGEALLWVRGYAPELIEVNAPIAAVRRTSRSMAYRAQFYEQLSDLSYANIQALRRKPRVQLRLQDEALSAAALEEWLCG